MHTYTIYIYIWTDYCGARAAGFQALLLDRSDDAGVVAYQVTLSLYI